MRNLLSCLFLLFCITSLFAQNATLCDSMLIAKDTSILIGDTVTLQGRGMFEYDWSPAFPNPKDSIQKVHPTQTTTYYLTGYYLDTNVVFNGDFELGNTGFTSEYIHTTVRINEEYYAVGTNCHKFHESLPDIYDHTSGHGNFMIVNGSPAKNKQVWSQIVPVHPNTNYVFITWVTSFCLPAADLQFSINGEQIGEIFHSPQILGEWQQFYQIWNSGASTEAVITILNQNTVKQGNDFGLDDISFSAFIPCEDSVTVSVILPITARNDTLEVCVGGTITFSPTANDSIDSHCDIIYPNLLTPPTHCDVSVDNTIFTVTTHDDFSGIDSMTYSICCSGLCDTATIYLQINSQPHIEVNYFGCDSLRWNNELILESGDYTQTFLTDHGCDSTVLAHVVIKHDTIAIEDMQENFCLHGMTSLAATTDLDNLQWSTGESSTEITVREPGKYWVSAGDSLCFASDTIDIDVCCPDADYQIPNVITPSTPDGFNDVFQLPDSFTPATINIKIYDRWGKLVFESTDPDFSWNGTVGDRITPGVYYYALMLNRQCPYNGSITVF